MLAVGCGGSQAQPAGTTGNLCAEKATPSDAVKSTRDDIVKDVVAAIRSGDGSGLDKHIPTFDEAAGG